MLASLGHQVGIATCSAHHATQSWVLVKEGLGRCSHVPGSSFGFSPLKNPSTFGSSMGGPPRSSSLCCDQSAVSRATDGGRVICLYRPWPVCGLRGCLCVKVQTGFLKSDLPSGLHGAGWRHLPLGSIPRVTHWWGVSPCDSSYAFYFLSTLYILTAGDWLITPSYHTAHETEWLSCCMCPSSMAAMARTWQWASLATLRASSQDSCCLSLKWPEWS